MNSEALQVVWHIEAATLVRSATTPDRVTCAIVTTEAECEQAVQEAREAHAERIIGYAVSYGGGKLTDGARERARLAAIEAVTVSLCLAVQFGGRWFVVGQLRPLPEQVTA